MGLFYEFRADMKRKIKQIICRIFGHDNKEEYSKEYTSLNLYKGYCIETKSWLKRYRCRRCGKVECKWESENLMDSIKRTLG